ncbi:MAG: hypothetical protein HYX62_09420 [Gammaproteobacteria bacterium]|nr:hypothetical protein [Gammaproteobacteria bacterium]
MKARYVTAALIFTLALAGCGGGGGDGGPSGITYAGLTTQAVVTQANAKNLAGGAYQGRATGNALGGVAASAQTNVTDHQINRPHTLALSETLRNAVGKIDVTTLPKADLGAAVKTETITEQGSCGGGFSGSATYDDVTGNISSGSITFSNYCSEGVTLSGRISFSGKVSVGTPTPTIQKIDMSFTSLSSKSGSDAFTTSGSIAIDATVPLQVLTTINMVMRDDTAGKVYKMENYQVFASVNPSVWVDVSMGGRFYGPDDGYVDLTTPTPFRFYITAGVVAAAPSQGVLVVTGGNGTKASLVAISTTDYNINVDADGNGNYESQIPGKWADL